MKTVRLLMLALIASLGTNVMYAQSANEQGSLEQEKVEFSPYTFMQFQGGVAYTVGDVGFKHLISPAAAFSFGRWFTPKFALRFGVNGWESRGGWDAGEIYRYKHRFIQANLDAMFNLNELFGDYDPERTTFFYGLLGVGLNHSFDNDEAARLALKGVDVDNLWTGSKRFLAGRAGLGLNTRLNDYVDFNVELAANALSDKFDSRKNSRPDWYFDALVGLTIKFGSGKKKPVPVYYEPEPVPAPAPAPEPTPEPVVKEEPKPVLPPKPAAIQRDIFFALNKSVVRENQMAKIDELVAYLVKYPEAKVSIVGYADKKTGNSVINLRLSKERAAAVSKLLQEKGIEVSRITTDAKGDTVQPFEVSEENRVTICIAE